MSRISVCTDPSRWHGAVINWLDRRLERVEKTRKKYLQRTEGEPPSGPTRELTRQLLRDLDVYLGLAKMPTQHTGDFETTPIPDAVRVQYAGWIVAYFYAAKKNRQPVDSRVVEYIDSARDRYCRDRKRNIAKALGLVRLRRGNPGGVSPKRRLTPDGFVEAGQMVLEKMHKGKSENFAVDAIANLLNVSPRTVRKASAAEKEARKGRPIRHSRQFPE